MAVVTHKYEGRAQSAAEKQGKTRKQKLDAELVQERAAAMRANRMRSEMLLAKAGCLSADRHAAADSRRPSSLRSGVGGHHRRAHDEPAIARDYGEPAERVAALAGAGDRSELD
jgi:hypothetical protein